MPNLVQSDGFAEESNDAYIFLISMLDCVVVLICMLLCNLMNIQVCTRINKYE